MNHISPANALPVVLGRQLVLSITINRLHFTGRQLHRRIPHNLRQIRLPRIILLINLRILHPQPNHGCRTNQSKRIQRPRRRKQGLIRNKGAVETPHNRSTGGLNTLNAIRSAYTLLNGTSHIPCNNRRNTPASSAHYSTCP